MNKNITKPKKPEIFQINSKPYGRQYSKWTEKWWQWAFWIPKNQNPIMDKTGENSGIGQSGPVWYLAGTTGNTSRAKRNCVIPHGRSILFPIIVSQYSRSEKPGMSDRELIRYISKDINQTSLLEAAVDEINLTDLSRFRIKSRRTFQLDMVKDNIWDVKSGTTKAVSDGFWVFLKPLTKGKHTIYFHGIEPNFETSVTYNIDML